MSTFSYSTIGIGNRDVTQIKTTVGLASRLEIGDWAYVDSPDNSDVIIVEARKAAAVAARYGASHLLVALVRQGEVTTAPVSLEWPAGYTALVSLFRSLETRIPAHATHSSEAANDQAVRRASDSTDTFPPPEPAPRTAGHDSPKPPPPVQSALSPPTVETVVPDTASLLQEPDHTSPVEPPIETAEDKDDSMVDLEMADISPLLDKASAITDDSPVAAETTAESPAQAQEQLSKEALTPAPPEHGVKSSPVVNLTLIRGGRQAAAPEIEPPSLDKVVRPARRFYPASRILGMVRSVIANGAGAEISHPNYPPLSIFPVSEWFQFDAALDECPALFRVSSTELFFREISNQKKPRSTQEWSPRPLWALSFTAAYFGSEGRLMQHCSPWDQLQLLREPDFSLLPHEDEHPELARYLLDHQANIETIAKDTGIALASIIDFTNACQEAHLLHRIPQQSNGDEGGHLPQQQQEKAHRYRVFSWFKKPFSRH